MSTQTVRLRPRPSPQAQVRLRYLTLILSSHWLRHWTAHGPLPSSGGRCSRGCRDFLCSTSFTKTKRDFQISIRSTTPFREIPAPGNVALVNCSFLRAAHLIACPIYSHRPFLRPLLPCPCTRRCTASSSTDLICARKAMHHRYK